MPTTLNLVLQSLGRVEMCPVHGQANPSPALGSVYLNLKAIFLGKYLGGGKEEPGPALEKGLGHLACPRGCCGAPGHCVLQGRGWLGCGVCPAPGSSPLLADQLWGCSAAWLHRECWDNGIIHSHQQVDDRNSGLSSDEVLRCRDPSTATRGCSQCPCKVCREWASLCPNPPWLCHGAAGGEGSRVAYFCHAGWGLAPKAQGPRAH